MEEDFYEGLDIGAILEQQEEKEKNKEPDESVKKKERHDDDEIITVERPRIPINLILVEYNEDGGSLKGLIEKEFGKGTSVSALWYDSRAQIDCYKKYSVLINNAISLDAPNVIIVKEYIFEENFEDILSKVVDGIKHIYVILQENIPSAVSRLNKIKSSYTEAITQVFFTQVRDKVLGPEEEKEQDEIIEEEEIVKENDYIDEKE